MHKILKACPCVLVDYSILAFQHPFAGCQIPKGTVEAGEAIEAAVLRELQEESGIKTGKIVGKIGVFDWQIPAGTATFKANELQQWHLYQVDPGLLLPDRWDHEAEGSPEEAGLVFQYFWQPLTDVPSAFHPVYHKVIELAAVYCSP